jgi:transposase-like protein
MSKKYICPYCGLQKSWLVRRGNRKCKICRKEWTPPQYPVRGFRINSRKWKLILDTYLRDKTGVAVSEECGITLRSTYRITNAIHQVMTKDVPETLSGIVEVDATYVGGAWKNKKIHIRRTGTKPGRGTKKQAIFGIAQRNPNQVRVLIIKAENREYVLPVIKSIVPLGSYICSDECSAYQILNSEGYHHETVNHRSGEYVRGYVHQQTLEGFWGLMKNQLASKGGIRRSNLHLFIAEYVWRYNHRKLSRKEQVQRLFSLLKSI